MKVYELRNVSYRYPTGEWALRGINMDVERGETLAIVGPNGAGKTTLLKLMDALVMPTEGEILFEGKPITEDTMTDGEFRRKVGFLFQNPDVMLFSATVLEDVAFGPVHLWSKERGLERAREELRRLGIEKLADRHPYSLSGGEKKKASIACVTAMEPEVLLLDEPTRDLDLRNRNFVLDMIRSWKGEGKTVVVVTHDLRLIRLADRVYVVNKEILFEGTPRELFSRPELIERANLDVPEIVRLFHELGINEIPLSVEEAVEILRGLLQR
ncbi:energy-coupling factor ABC transporter ATP-binding protein [Thermococcus sp. 21S9]|uniref:energy-coupling factor ABC transporter ATP-binding protein n=1 Tax=Thermococcus sp. 21S9 TaxID=1638223 RepID=UPI00143B2D08|nr:ABC transporter ATP-binding protein [Thermococcus sp. 21S9]NJE55042.1 ABC transporter ATP-binding protein [Thermococcus sp. 21S9]